MAARKKSSTRKRSNKNQQPVTNRKPATGKSGSGSNKRAPRKTGEKDSAGAKTGSEPGTDEIPVSYYIREVEQLAAIASSRRQKIFAEFVEQARTTKQVAERLGEPPTRLYHHVDALVQQGLLVLQREEKKRGTTEKYYRAVARQIRVDDDCLATDEGFRDENMQLVCQMLDQARHGLVTALDELGSREQPPFSIAAATTMDATDDEMEQVTNSLLDAMNQADTKRGRKNKKGEARRSFRIMLLVFPDEEET